MNITEKEYKNLCKSVKKKIIKTLSEPEIQAQIKGWLSWQGWFIVRHQQGLGSHKGLSDLIVLGQEVPFL